MNPDVSVVMAEVTVLSGWHEVNLQIPAGVVTVLSGNHLMGPWIQEMAMQFLYQNLKLQQLAVHMY